MNTPPPDALDKDAYIQEVLARAEPYVLESVAPVSEWAIRAWCGALGDFNPVYLDARAAAEAGYRTVIAPPVLMHGFTLPALLKPETDSPARRLRRRLAGFGFTSVVAVTYEQTYHNPILVGDVLTREVIVSDISALKTTALGPGHFVTTTHRVTNQNNELIGVLLVRVLYFRPSSLSADKPAANAPAGIMPDAAGTMIPPRKIRITTTLIITAALASNDFELVHHDRAHAQREGLPDIIMNILTSSGLVLRYVTDWGGPRTVIKKLSLRLKANNCPGDTLLIKGAAQTLPDGETIVNVSGINERGQHLEAAVTLRLP